MTEIITKIDSFISLINGYLWGPPLLILLLGVHIFLTFKLKFIQRYIFKGIKLSITNDNEKSGDVTQFGALVTALAATIGTGNIIGVATAVSLGGVGAIFWMWLTGVLGIATKYSEALLAVKFREKTADGTIIGGPMYVLEKGLNLKWLAILFSIFTAIAAFGIGNMVQANSISNLLNETYNVSFYVSGSIIALLTAITILGGVTKIAKVCSYLVPFMAGFYILGCLTIIVLNYHQIIPAITLILKSAFGFNAIASGFIGVSILASIRYGVARGLFSNESGLGSAPIIAAAAKTKNSVRQALISATGTFWDTVVICALTGIVITISIINNPNIALNTNGAQLAKLVFNQIPIVGNFILTIGLLTFVFSTILGWSYYGEKALEYLFGKISVKPYRILWVIATMVGAITPLHLIWNLADMMNALMAIPNLISLIFLNKVIISETKKYLWNNNLNEEDPTINNNSNSKYNLDEIKVDILEFALNKK